MNVFNKTKMKDFQENNRCIVRLSTSYFRRGNNIVMEKSIRTLKKSSNGYDTLNEECDMIGAEDMIHNIVNFNTCDDGIYQLLINDWSTDWETGIIDSVNFKLVPYDKIKEEA